MTSQLKYKPYFIYKITGRLVLFFTNLQDAIELKDKITRDVKIPENFEITLDDYFGEFSKKSSTNCKIPLTKDNEYGIIIVGLWRLTLLTSFVGMPPYHFANIFGGCNHV